MACSTDINVSQGSVATYARCCGSVNISLTLTTNFPRNFPVIFFGHESVALFFAHPVYAMQTT